MLQKLRKNKGFTLIELMIVVAIIGIMAAIAIPNFLSYLCKSKQSEAKQHLGAIATLEESYYAERNNYGSDTAVGWATPVGSNVRYSTTAAGGATTWVATATSTTVSGTNTDTWTMNQSRILSNTVLGCS